MWNFVSFPFVTFSSYFRKWIFNVSSLKVSSFCPNSPSLWLLVLLLNIKNAILKHSKEQTQTEKKKTWRKNIFSQRFFFFFFAANIKEIFFIFTRFFVTSSHFSRFFRRIPFRFAMHQTILHMVKNLLLGFISAINFPWSFKRIQLHKLIAGSLRWISLNDILSFLVFLKLRKPSSMFYVFSQPRLRNRDSGFVFKFSAQNQQQTRSKTKQQWRKTFWFSSSD